MSTRALLPLALSLSKPVLSRVEGGLVLALVLAAASAACTDGGPQSTPSPSGQPSATSTASPLPAMTITFNPGADNETQLLVEIADSADERQRGLMFRESVPENSGMLFDFGQETGSAFWMKDTAIPLSIAFISADGRIIDIQDMAPLDETLHRSPQPYRYAVETNQGWFEERGVEVGDEVRLAAGTPVVPITAGSPAVKACVAADLTGAITSSNGLTGGQIVAGRTFGNKTDTPCSLEGVPQLELLDSQGSILPIQAFSLCETMDGLRCPLRQQVVLAPGTGDLQPRESRRGRARVRLYWPTYTDGPPCSPPPGDAVAIRVLVPSDGALDASVAPEFT